MRWTVVALLFAASGLAASDRSVIPGGCAPPLYAEGSTAQAKCLEQWDRHVAWRRWLLWHMFPADAASPEIDNYRTIAADSLANLLAWRGLEPPPEDMASINNRWEMAKGVTDCDVDRARALFDALITGKSAFEDEGD